MLEMSKYALRCARGKRSSLEYHVSAIEAVAAHCAVATSTPSRLSLAEARLCLRDRVYALQRASA